MKKFLHTIFLIIAFAFAIQSVKFRSRYVIMWRNISCTYDPKYVRYVSCNIVQPQQKYISSYLVYAKDMNPGYMVNAILDVLHPSGQIINILNLDIDVCKFFAKEHENNLVKLVRQSFDEHSNFTGCPLYKDVAFGLFNYTINLTKLPYAPEAEFSIILKFSLPQNNETLRYTLNGSLELRGKRPIRVMT